MSAREDKAKLQGALEEAAKHADCCVDREERDRLRDRGEALARAVERLMMVRGDRSITHGTYDHRPGEQCALCEALAAWRAPR
jgi:hypothetical protein